MDAGEQSAGLGAPKQPPAADPAAANAPAKKRGRPRGARNKASRLQMVPAVLILRPGDAVREKIRAYANKHNVSVVLLSMSGAVDALPLLGALTPLPGPLAVVSVSGAVLRETVDGTTSNTLEKTFWMSICCATASGQCVGASLRGQDE